MEKRKKTNQAKKLKLIIKAEPRKIYGRKVKKLREQNLLPANLYGKDTKSQALKVDLKEFLDIYKKAGETNVVDLIISKNKKSYKILFHNLQIHPVDDQPQHVDFHKIDLTKSVQISIPIELKGDAPGITKGGIVVQTLNEIEVEALPNDLPDKFTVDISSLKEIGDSVTVKNLAVDKKKVKILVEDENQLIVNLKAPKEEKEEEKPEITEEAEAEEETKEESKKEEKKIDEKKQEQEDKEVKTESEKKQNKEK